MHNLLFDRGFVIKCRDSAVAVVQENQNRVHWILKRLNKKWKSATLTTKSTSWTRSWSRTSVQQCLEQSRALAVWKPWRSEHRRDTVILYIWHKNTVASQTWKTSAAHFSSTVLEKTFKKSILKSETVTVSILLSRFWVQHSEIRQVSGDVYGFSPNVWTWITGQEGHFYSF